MHGGDIYSHNKKVIDFSSNINPLGVMPELKEYLIKCFDEVSVYPDIKYRRLKKNIADYLNVEPSQVVAGNGAVEIINNFILFFDRVVVFTPCFSEYVLRAKALNKEVRKFKYDSNFEIAIEELKNNIRPKDLIILGNPNNPNGKRIDREVLINLAVITQEKGAFLMLDEAFYEFCPYDYDSIELLKNFDDICIIRAATKFFALPGIRLGYAKVSANWAERYKEIELPWSINSFADAATEIIFKNKDYIKKSKEYINEERQYMLNILSKIKNIVAYKTDANFILIKLLKYDEDFIYNRLLEKGILIRKCSNIDGLDKSYIRIAIKSREYNDLILKELIDILGE
ncbi:Threonine-phosphate decarboxylase [Caloramator mitchellensis]|uniref:Threonine-phosphate decarboxylase n=1 Tax=Caloramator mitchellensis TaxID=908809 RepID=A0A0R3JR32_CALMK|nr:histidinol-phosphate transaminase [Caloramator mitchellensis]KRQ85923.1 Threonine-phosphate decarboxylase [Caloramator mitchellensis]